MRGRSQVVLTDIARPHRNMDRKKSPTERLKNKWIEKRTDGERMQTIRHRAAAQAPVECL